MTADAQGRKCKPTFIGCGSRVRAQLKRTDMYAKHHISTQLHVP